MAVAFGSASSREDGGTADASHSFSFNAGSESNRTLVVAVAAYSDNSDCTVDTCSYNSVGMTKAKEADYSWGGTRHNVASLWTLDNPASGANTVSVTLNATPNQHFYVHAAYYTGANNGNGANTASATGNITDHEYDNTGTDSDGFMVQCVERIGVSLTAGTGYNIRSASTDDQITLGDEVSANAAVTVGGTLDGTNRSASGVFELLPAAAAPAGGLPPWYVPMSRRR